MKIIFINSIIRNKKNSIQLGTAILATILRQNNYCVEIIDFNYLCNSGEISSKAFEEEDYRTFGNYLLSKKPDVVCFSTMANSFFISILIAKYIRENESKIKIVFGGPQVSLCALDSMNNFPWIDIICIGEGEKSILPIINSIEKKLNLSSINGIAYRKDEEVHVNNKEDLIENLDELPYIDYSLLPYINEVDFFPLDVGRGCPFSCKYCSTKTFWKRRYRLKSPKRIIEEINIIKGKYNIRSFSFEHDLFTANKDKILEFCEEVQKQNLNIQWSCSCRIDTLDEEIIEKINAAGCRKIFLGIETGSERVQKLINKNLKLDDIWEAIRLLKKYSMHINVSFIVGFPGEKINDVKQTLNLVRDFLDEGIDDIIFGFLAIFVGTEYYYEFKESLKLLPRSFFSTANEGVYAHNHLELLKTYPEIFPNFYMIENSFLGEIEYLDRFILYYVKALHKKYNLTYKYLMEFYKNDLFMFYLGMKDCLKKHSEVINNSIDECVDNILFFERLSESIRAFIYSNDFSDKTDFIRNIFRFELELFKFINEDNDEEIYTSNYEYDVYKVKKEMLSMENYHSEKITIKFIKLNNKVRLQKWYLPTE